MFLGFKDYLCGDTEDIASKDIEELIIKALGEGSLVDDPTGRYQKDAFVFKVEGDRVFQVYFEEFENFNKNLIEYHYGEPLDVTNLMTDEKFKIIKNLLEVKDLYLQIEKKYEKL